MSYSGFDDLGQCRWHKEYGCSHCLGVRTRLEEFREQQRLAVMREQIVARSGITVENILLRLVTLSASETIKAEEWRAEGRLDMAELCAGRASILNRVIYEFTNHG
jgi:hypothetical protein